MSEKDWFASWFDTSYYHILYDHRNEDEAILFIQKLIEHLKLQSGSHVLDLACGKGRHARTLHTFGLNVLGTDLSPQSIEFAEQFATDGLQFQVQDMRETLPNVCFDAIFNLFTSFGYFDVIEDNRKVIASVHEMLAKQGVFVIDFLNPTLVKNTLVPEEVIEKQGITFHIHRKIEAGFVVKHIDFVDQGKTFHFEEKVQLFGLKDFQQMLEGLFTIQAVFGDYHLNPYHENESKRLLLIAEKI